MNPHTPSRSGLPHGLSAAAMPAWRAQLLRMDALGMRVLPWLQTLALLAVRLFLLDVFFRAGLSKLLDWDSTLFLFQEEYRVPLLPPELAAVMGTAGELGLSSLLALGLLTRPAAVGLFLVNLMAVISYPDLTAAGLKDHQLWGVLCMVLALFGPGALSADGFLWRWLRGR